MRSLNILTIGLVVTLVTSVVTAQNPLDFGSKIRTADPSGHVWADGRMYLYTSHDQECQEDFWMKDWQVFSSEDLVHWTDHGACLNVDDLTWADNYAWAPDCAYKNGKYYFCFPAGTGFKDRVNPENSTKWMGIGIAVSDSPTGPFVDEIGGPLWRDPYANDPSLFVDDDGKAYLYVHGGRLDFCVAEMADDMKSLKGEFVKMDMGGYEPKMEGPWVFKRQGKYYFTMPENNRVLTYYMADTPKGPWTYQGQFMEQEHQSNNHHSIVEFKGQWILFYHRWLDLNSECGRQRHCCAEYLHFNDDGTIQPVKRTEAGVGDFPSRVSHAPEKSTKTPWSKARLLWQTEPLFETPEAVLYDAKRDMLYVSNYQLTASSTMKKEFLSKVDPNGQVIDLHWIEGLKQPTGMAIYEDVLYVVERRRLTRIDIDQGTILERIRIRSSSFANDITFDAQGVGYISDNGSKPKYSIHRYQDGKVSPWIPFEELDNPNGLLVDGSYLIAYDNQREALVRIALETGKIEIIAPLKAVAEAMGDGLVQLDADTYLVTAWGGPSWSVSKAGVVIPLVDTSSLSVDPQPQVSQADVGYIPEHKTWIAPTFFANRLMAYQFVD